MNIYSVSNLCLNVEIIPNLVREDLTELFLQFGEELCLCLRDIYLLPKSMQGVQGFAFACH